MPAGRDPGRVQSAQGLGRILSPRSIAVIGASPTPSSVGHRLLANILKAGFAGAVHPVNPTAGDILGRPAFRRVQDIPGPIDLAVVAVPAGAVRQVLQDCAEKRVGGLVVVTAGFRETGSDGARLESEVGDLAREAGMRLVGPNCLGVVNGDPAVRLNAIFADVPTHAGPVGLMTQSGALGIALLDRAHRIGLGIGRFVSLGNKVDVSGNDLLLHWQDDPGVRVIAMHLESIGNPRNFVRIARQVATTKPILLVKGGRTPEGARAAGSHTGAMLQSDALVDAMVRQAGVVRVGTVEELFDAALALSLQPLPTGNRVAVVTNSGGPAILFADALPGAGLRLAEPAATTLRACAAQLPRDAAIANPLDMLAGASPAALTACLREFLRDPGIDAAVAMITPLAEDDTPWADAILAARQGSGKTLAAVLFGRDAQSAGYRRLVQAGVPTYTFPENAVRALGAMARASNAKAPAKPAVAATRTANAAAPARAGWASLDEALQAAAGLGAATPRSRRAATPDEAAEVAAQLGFPVALKLAADGLVHKTDVGAVRLGLASRADVLEAARQAWERVQAAGFTPRSILVQTMAPPGLEMLVGAVRDEKFGPILTVGLGGIHAEAIRDVAVALAPATEEEVDALLVSLRGRRLLDPLRGEPGKDIDALRSVAVALGRFMADNPNVQEFEVNPLRVHATGAGVTAVDARMRLSEPSP